MTDIVEQLQLLESGARWVCNETADTLEQAAEEIERLRSALLKLRASLLLADSACQTYWEWEYGNGDTDPSLLTAWRKDYEGRILPIENDHD